MCEQQLDLFSSADIQADRPLPLSVELCPAATVLDDQALIAAIPDSNLADSIALAAEAGRRRLAAAVPSLETLCRRFSGFGIHHMVPEQAAALQALAAIGGREAAQAVSQLIVRAAVQGPTFARPPGAGSFSLDIAHRPTALMGSRRGASRTAVVKCPATVGRPAPRLTDSLLRYELAFERRGLADRAAGPRRQVPDRAVVLSPAPRRPHAAVISARRRWRGMW